MNTTTKIRKGSFVKVNVPVKRYNTLPDGDTLPADNVYQVTYVSRNGNDLRIYGKDLIGSRNVKLSDVTVVDGPKPVVNVGDLFSCSWGYDQTNVDFYMVVKVTGKSAWLEKIPSTRTYDGPMSGTCVPVCPNLLSGQIGTGEQHRIKMLSDGTVCFRLTSYSHAFPYKGGDCFFSEWH